MPSPVIDYETPIPNLQMRDLAVIRSEIEQVANYQPLPEEVQP